MLDAETKRKIDSLRDILVGIIPNPQTQIDHITTGLIYKFIYDMDQESISMGGKASFFTGDYERYSWDKLFDSKLGGSELSKLYRDAVESFYVNPNAPELFRDLFKNASSPTTNAPVLKMFLKEINEFKYSNSETLGNAFEYLLSFMGSQGDAGQFRTPRHIIDFVVDIINPQKNESVLDPACGTAGFLISAYKHICKNKLSATEIKKVTENIHGYDITPEMVRLSQVNMYLHNFVNPNIHEYDTLSSDERWNEYFDVILANPPFMTPKGGIQPHNRFGIESTKSEVLFTDYILEHLKSNGRAGIIVPDGIVSRNGKAYKDLRKNLINGGLVGVISMPAGIFKPYSGVKTHILILNKTINKNFDSIFISRIKNDGYELGDQRKPINENDLPEILKIIKEFISNSSGVSESENFRIFKKEQILNTSTVSLSFQKYIKNSEKSSDYEIVNINDYVDFKRGTSITKETAVEGDIPVIGGGKKSSYFHNQHNRDGSNITISSSGANAGYIGFYNGKIYASDCFTVNTNSDLLNQKFLYYVLKSQQDYIYTLQSGGAQPHVYIKDFESFEIPLPDLNAQLSTVSQLDSYQAIIDNCISLNENYKPTFIVGNDWEIYSLGEIGEIYSGGTPKTDNNEYWNGIIPWITLVDVPAINNINFINNSIRKITDIGLNKSSAVIIPVNSIIFSSRATIGRVGINLIPLATNQGFKSIHIKDTNKFDPLFIAYSLLMMSDYFKSIATGGVYGEISKTVFSETEIHIPSLELQKEIVLQLNREKDTINNALKLADVFSHKITATMNLLWGEI
jgi:type I restriction enzyme M protein